ncbi:RlpA-like protein, double-psi beta-barrel domain [Sesbania bispinosa]|nr:RlpA-like protein, double-psi beta-barrel domain [Sesbania bispinosa]
MLNKVYTKTLARLNQQKKWAVPLQYTNSRASYYSTPDGYGYPRGACGFRDYGRTVNDGSVATVSAKLWKNGVGCGACYQVRCKIPELCDVNGTYVVVTDNYGQGDGTDIIMSPRGFSKLGSNPAATDKLKKYNGVDIEYKRVPCSFKGNNIVFQINEQSKKPGYFSITVLYVGGTYDVTAVEMWQQEHNKWEPLQRTNGAVFGFGNPPNGDIHLRFQERRSTGLKWVKLLFPVPANWKVGDTFSFNM